MSDESSDVSIVEYYLEKNGYKCGYCKSPNTNYSHGMWAHSLTVQDYQALIDRGWRRSGCYCYKPTLHLTCCPMYTIKCSVLDFKLSKSQKKKIKKFNCFLAQGKRNNNASTSQDKTSELFSDLDSGDDLNTGFGNDIPNLKEKAERAQLNIQSTIIQSVDATFLNHPEDEMCKIKKVSEESTSLEPIKETSTAPIIHEERLTQPPVKKHTRPGDGMDLNRPICKKAKLLRQERREKKLSKLDSSAASFSKTTSTTSAKSLEDLIHETLPDSPAHSLKIRLVRSSPASKEFKSTLKASFELYQKYQITIHNDAMEKLTEKQFTRFLVNSPLKINLVRVGSSEMNQTLNTSWVLFAKYQMAIHKEEPSECDMESFLGFLVNSPLKPWKPKDGPPQGYGSFHQQYWLDDQLIAVGVIDILPYCVSSVYFYYDPEFNFLVLGTYGSLREIAFCRSLHHYAPDLRYYYMGFYIHSCPKMRYKGSYSPSYLLCPEVYSWHPIEYCIQMLEKTKYCRFTGNPGAQDPDKIVGIEDVCVLFHNKMMRYQTYCALKQFISNEEEVKEYTSLVGSRLSKRMLLVLM